MMGEEYLGGFTSGDMRRGRMRGYGLYFTTTRVIGVKRTGRAFAAALVGSAVGGRAFGRTVGQALARDEGIKMIQDLDEKKDFDLAKVDLASIALKKPGFFSGGHILFGPKNGEMVKVKVGAKRDFNNLKELVNRFYPEAMSFGQVIPEFWLNSPKQQRNSPGKFVSSVYRFTEKHPKGHFKHDQQALIEGKGTSNSR